MKAARRGMTLDIGDLPMVDVMCARAELARLAEGVAATGSGASFRDIGVTRLSADGRS